MNDLPFAATQDVTAVGDATDDAPALDVALALPPPPVVFAPTTDDFETAVALEPPNTVDERYEVLDLLGEGGMGAVHRVRHRRLGRIFAMKTIREQWRGHARVNRIFVREARLASSLSHAHIVSVIDYGDDAIHGPYMVMELLEGRPLSARLRDDGRLAPRLACEILLQVAKAMAFVHRHGIIHLDLKADNVFVCTPTGDDRRTTTIKLLDFGLARNNQTDTMTDVVDGTPAYIAPERLTGAKPVPSMDIYSFGALAFELFTGRPPFVGELTDVLQAHADRPPPRFTDLGITDLEARAEEIVQRALAKDPAARQPSMDAMVYELRTLRDMFGNRRAATAKAARVPRATPDWLEPAYAQAPLPMAALDAEGRIDSGNAAFWKFLLGPDQAPRPGLQLDDTAFRKVCPTITHDVRRTWVTGRTRCLKVRLDADHTIDIWLYVAEGAGERVLVLVHGA